MSHEFKGAIQNAFRPEGGVNIVVKGLEDEKVILAPTGFAHEFDKKQDGDTLSFTLTPSSGTTEGRDVQVELVNGEEKVTASDADWKVEIKSTDKSKPVEAGVAIYTKAESE